MDCASSSGLATACSCWMSAAPNSSPSPTVCSRLAVPKKPSTGGMDGLLLPNTKPAISTTTICHFEQGGPSPRHPPTRVALGGEAHRRIDGMTAPFAWAAPSGQAPTPAGGAPPLRRDGLDGEGARQAIIVVAPDAASPPKVGFGSTDWAAGLPYRFRHALQRTGSGTGTPHSNPMSIARRQARSRSW